MKQSERFFREKNNSLIYILYRVYDNILLYRTTLCTKMRDETILGDLCFPLPFIRIDLPQHIS